MIILENEKIIFRIINFIVYSYFSINLNNYTLFIININYY